MSVRKCLFTMALLTGMSTPKAETRCEVWIAQLASAQGRVEMQQKEEVRWRPVQIKEVFCQGDKLRTWEKSRASLALTNETYLDVDQRTTVIFSDLSPKRPSWLELIKGALYFRSRTPSSLDIRTPFVNAAIRGTEFLVEVRERETRVTVYDGRVVTTNAKGTLTAQAGESVLARQGEAPRPYVRLHPEDAVQWALYYPPVIDFKSLPRTGLPPALQRVLDAYVRNDLAAALAALDAVPEAERTALFSHLKAGLLLTVGRVEEARPVLAAALQRDPKDATAKAQQAIIALARNDRASALEQARAAAASDPRSAAAQIALSYVHQARFELERALKHSRRAVALDSHNALAQVRLAELELSLGHLKAGERAARRALRLNPHQARARTLLGFAELLQIDTDQALARFDQAIAQDAADPLSRFGRGLARIRQGKLREGTAELELAASLDPNDALIRSYLGKAYYEQKRSKPAQSELDIAKGLDPNDPTPYFYDAIKQQTENRPVEALHNLQKAIERNDNRAVYRSRLLLDEDRAVRGTSLARIYDDLGFNRRAFVEATKSLSLNPADHSAHRFLSDTYGRLPRHQIARVSELLQAQLLQPININPIQPQLNETNLNIVTGAGPARATFNEYARLFERNRPQLILSGLLGNNDTFGDEAVLSGIHNKISYSLGQLHYETDGFRHDADIRHNIYNAFLQAALTDKLNVQFEYRHRETDQGDLRLNFDPDFVPAQRRRLEQETGRLGLHAALSSRSDFIGSLIYSDRKTNLKGDRQDFNVNDRGYDTQGRYLFRSDLLNFTLGGGAYRIDRRQTTGRPTIVGGNAYAYANLLIPKTLAWTLGLGYDSFDNETIAPNAVNPKLGAQWHITEHLRLRAAYLKTLKRLLIVNQTIEPTQVAGFNQFFDEPNGAKSELLGAGFDIIARNNLYGGFEFTRRNLEVPVSGLIDVQKEDAYRAYFYWAPRSQWALSAEYRFERFRSEIVPPDKIETASIPVSIRHFSPSGIFSELGATFVSQEVGRIGTTGNRRKEEFVWVDAAIGYRLPKRWGIISLEARNLLNEHFLFQDLELRSADPFTVTREFIPDRTILGRITLNFF
jgi:tetratricopeptide (TPR) repeat protein